MITCSICSKICENLRYIMKTNKSICQNCFVEKFCSKDVQQKNKIIKIDQKRGKA